MTTSHSRFDDELERRLALIERPDYQDPARADLTASDMLMLLLVIVVVLVLTGLILLG